MPMPTPEAAVRLTPSEEALFHADQLVPKGSMLKGKEDALLAEGSVAVKPLAELMFSVAILALEKAGTVRLQHVQRKAMFGLLKKQVVEVHRAGAAAPFPTGTIEALLARQVPASGAIDAVDLVYHFFTRDMQWPQQLVLDVAKSGLGERGLLKLENTKKMLVFTTVKATVPDEVRAALAGRAPDAVRALVKDAEGRGELWKHLQAQVQSGLARRTEAPDTGSGTDRRVYPGG
jgi:hypothetical protein